MYFFKEEICQKVKDKMCFYKSLLLHVLTYEVQLIIVSRLYLQKLKEFQKRELKWITSITNLSTKSCYDHIFCLSLCICIWTAYFIYWVYYSRICTRAPFQIQVTQKRKKNYSSTSKGSEPKEPDMSSSTEWDGLSKISESKWISFWSIKLN